MAESDALPDSWREPLGPLLETPEARRLDSFLKTEEAAGKHIYPPRGSRFAAMALTPLDAVKVVILGQDPYHGPGQAHGLSFSVARGVKVPSSLANIYKELNSDLGLAAPGHGNLESWGRQGVLLLNDVLTVEQGKAHSHANMGWEPIMLWGKPAQKKGGRIADLNASRHLVLAAPHPSGLSAYKGFWGCRHFSQANTFLAENGRGPIDWQL